jgi:esterase
MLYSRIEGDSGKPLIIIHGFMGMSDNWKTLSLKYVEKGFRVHAVDMRNHGKSFHSDIFTYDAMVEDLLQYINTHNLGKVDIIGHSMGGKAAMFFAINYPQLLDRLVVADIGPQYYPPHHQDVLDALNAVDFSTKPSRNELEEVMAQHLPDAGTRQFLMKSLYWVEQGQLGFRFNLPVFNAQVENIGEALPEGSNFTGPVLFLRGDRSKYIREQDLALIEKHFPHYEIKTINNSGHWIHAENPAEFLAYTLEFLTK